MYMYNNPIGLVLLKCIINPIYQSSIQLKLSIIKNSHNYWRVGVIVSGCNPFNLKIQVFNPKRFTNLVQFGSVSNLI